MVIDSIWAVCVSNDTFEVFIDSEVKYHSLPDTGIAECDI